MLRILQAISQTFMTLRVYKKGGLFRLPHEPKKRHSKSAKRVRRGSIKLSAISLVLCKNCNNKTLAHMACRSCGFYDGKLVGEAEVKVTKA